MFSQINYLKILWETDDILSEDPEIYIPTLPTNYPCSYDKPNVVYNINQRIYILRCQSPKISHILKIVNENT